jgi:hypothetical protein
MRSASMRLGHLLPMLDLNIPVTGATSVAQLGSIVAASWPRASSWALQVLTVRNDARGRRSPTLLGPRIIRWAAIASACSGCGREEACACLLGVASASVETLDRAGTPPSDDEWASKARIKACFDRLPHSLILGELRRRVEGRRVLVLRRSS